MPRRLFLSDGAGIVVSISCPPSSCAARGTHMRRSVRIVQARRFIGASWKEMIRRWHSRYHKHTANEKDLPIAVSALSRHVGGQSGCFTRNLLKYLIISMKPY